MPLHSESAGASEWKRQLYPAVEKVQAPDPSASLLVLCGQHPLALWHLCRRSVSISL